MSRDTAPDLDLLPPGCEIYTSYDGPARVVVLSHWANEADIAAYAGPGWGVDGSAEALAYGDAVAGEPHVWHFRKQGSPR